MWMIYVSYYWYRALLEPDKLLPSQLLLFGVFTIFFFRRLDALLESILLVWIPTVLPLPDEHSLVLSFNKLLINRLFSGWSYSAPLSYFSNFFTSYYNTCGVCLTIPTYTTPLLQSYIPIVQQYNTQIENTLEVSNQKLT